jgi:hypothetical protein
MGSSVIVPAARLTRARAIRGFIASVLKAPLKSNVLNAVVQPAWFGRSMVLKRLSFAILVNPQNHAFNPNVILIDGLPDVVRHCGR